MNRKTVVAGLGLAGITWVAAQDAATNDDGGSGEMQDQPAENNEPSDGTMPTERFTDEDPTNDPFTDPIRSGGGVGGDVGTPGNRGREFFHPGQTGGLVGGENMGGTGDTTASEPSADTQPSDGGLDPTTTMQLPLSWQEKTLLSLRHGVDPTRITDDMARNRGWV